MTAATQEQVLVAKKFCDVLRGRLGDDVDEVVRRNATEEYRGCCASHDFCDANMAMAEAYEAATGRAWDLDNEDEADDVWDASWGIAKAAGFDAAKII